MVSQPEVHRVLREVLADGVARIAQTSSTARAFAREPSRISEPVLIRHLIEHVHRIRMFRRLDARASRRLLAAHADIGADWHRYARSEAVHDRYFMRDLERIAGARLNGVGEPFAATRELVAFADEASKAYGPLPVVLYSYWAEENSDVGSAGVIARMEHLFGAQAVRGATAHRHLDETLDHAGVVVGVLAAIIPDSRRLCLAAQLLDQITRLIGDYFAALDDWSREGESSGLQGGRAAQSAMTRM